VSQPTYSTTFAYTNRASKAEYVWRKYSPLLSRRVLDVGADQCHLRPFVREAGGHYEGVGFGPTVDHEINLEKSGLPYGDRTFETVACLDTLEHLEAAHKILDELCRVADRYIIISLPNPWKDFWNTLRSKDYAPGVPIKYYGFPVQPPEDRHRWFFSESEANSFVTQRAEPNGFAVRQFDAEASRSLWMTGLAGSAQRWVFRRYFRKDIEQLGLTSGTLWWVLERTDSASR
jgi:hypothetical protein